MSFRAWKRGFRIAEIPIVFVDRTEGTSKMSKRSSARRSGWSGACAGGPSAARSDRDEPGTHASGWTHVLQDERLGQRLRHGRRHRAARPSDLDGRRPGAGDLRPRHGDRRRRARVARAVVGGRLPDDVPQQRRLARGPLRQRDAVLGAPRRGARDHAGRGMPRGDRRRSARARGSCRAGPEVDLQPVADVEASACHFGSETASAGSASRWPACRISSCGSTTWSASTWSDAGVRCGYDSIARAGRERQLRLSGRQRRTGGSGPTSAAWRGRRWRAGPAPSRPRSCST